MNHRNFVFRKNRAFSLIELLTVIAIIGILITLVTVAIRPIQMKSRDARRKSDINLVASGLSLFKSDFKVYPNYTMVLGTNSNTGYLNSSLDIAQDASNCQANQAGSGNTSDFTADLTNNFINSTVKPGFIPINSLLICLKYIDKSVADPTQAGRLGYQYRVAYDYADSLVSASLENTKDSDISQLFDNTNDKQFFVGVGKTVPQLNDDSDVASKYFSLTPGAHNDHDGFYLYQCGADAASPGTPLLPDDKSGSNYQPIKINAGARAANAQCANNGTLVVMQAYGQ